MAKVRFHTQPEGVEEYEFICLGCGGEYPRRIHTLEPTEPYDWGNRGFPHFVQTKGRVDACWKFNGDIFKPTFTPSLLTRIQYTDPNKQDYVCHLFIRDGMLDYLPDCTHPLTGKTIQMVDIYDPGPPYDMYGHCHTCGCPVQRLMTPEQMQENIRSVTGYCTCGKNPD